MTQALLYGIHDREGRHIVPAGGWCLDTVALSENPAPTDYAALRADINWIVRLNWGYGSTGTIPAPEQYDEFAFRCADYAAFCKGASRFIIGNEPNHENERPNGAYIWPHEYARCFRMCREIIKRARPDAQVIPAPCAPYHADPENWLDYWKEMLTLISANGGCDGIAVHAYTRSSDPKDIDSADKMGPPLEDTYSGFYTYLDACVAVPADMEYLPVYITEFNELLPEGWHDANTGVVQAAYADIDDSNRVEPEVQPVMCLILYRWPKYDKWYIEGKQGVIDDFQAAVSRGYKSPPVMGEIPAASPSTSSQSSQPREIDPRLIERGVTIETPQLRPGQQYWRVIKAQWYNEKESQGRHHIYADVLDSGGKRVTGVNLLVEWPTGGYVIFTEAKPGEPYSANYPMSPSRNEYSIRVGPSGEASETLKGIGMGAMTPSGYNAGIHTSTGVVFQLATVPQAAPDDETQTFLPSVGNGESAPTDDLFPRAMAFVKQWEGGYVDNPNDPGGATNKGITLGTYTRWREVHGQPAPTKDDLRNITDGEAEQIYRDWYWRDSGADKLPWPLALAHFDTAVNAGPGRAKEMLSKSEGNFLAYMGHLIDWYTRIPNFEHFGRAWIRRRADILKEASKT